MTSHRVRRRGIDLWLAIYGTALAALTAWAVDQDAFDRVDRLLFDLLNSLPERLHRPLWVAQLIGVLGVPIAVAAVAAATRRFRLALGSALLVPAKLVVEREILKQLVYQQRPGARIPGAILRDVPTAGSAFPSGHAMILFGMVTLLSPYLSGRALGGLFGFAAVATAARVYLGAHSPADVIGGAAAGLAIGAVLNLLVGVSRSPREQSPRERIR
ncbi:phosphatase PAP2 family protein [Nocardia noduli]|uniref:phosphatase PAP2 family protein n=1 Tax=Nocardia noduli TaxID=2815722 RepID=UPI001C23116C|nr:phosphatase PAP2 family protein [Nocardia noduli]